MDLTDINPEAVGIGAVQTLIRLTLDAVVQLKAQIGVGSIFEMVRT